MASSSRRWRSWPTRWDRWPTSTSGRAVGSTCCSTTTSTATPRAVAATTGRARRRRTVDRACSTCTTRRRARARPPSRRSRTRVGIDRAPDRRDRSTAARWLEACVWPDQADRFHRLGPRSTSPDRIDPNSSSATPSSRSLPTIERLGAFGHPVVTNSWVLNYLTSEARLAYLAELDRIGASRDLSWIFAEARRSSPNCRSKPTPLDPQRDRRCRSPAGATGPARSSTSPPATPTASGSTGADPTAS